MATRQQYARNGRIFTFFGWGSGVVDCDWRWNFFEKRRLFIFVNPTGLFGKTMCPIIAKKLNSPFSVLERNIQNVAASFAHFTVVETRLYRLNCQHTTHLFMFEKTKLQKYPVLCCPHTIFSFWIYLIEAGHWWTIVCGKTNSYFFGNGKACSVCSVVFKCSCNVKKTSWKNNQAPHFPQP